MSTTQLNAYLLLPKAYSVIQISQIIWERYTLLWRKNHAITNWWSVHHGWYCIQRWQTYSHHNRT